MSAGEIWLGELREMLQNTHTEKDYYSIQHCISVTEKALEKQRIEREIQSMLLETA